MAETTYVPFASETDAAPVRLVVRRVRPTPGSQLALLTLYDYHAFITDRGGETLALEADHRRHAEIENAIRDLKYGMALNHLPSGKFGANRAWLAVQVIAHNLARWTARLGLGAGIVTTKTLRRRFFSLAGRLTRSARREMLHLSEHWPWRAEFDAALARLRAIPLLAWRRDQSSLRAGRVTAGKSGLHDVRRPMMSMRHELVRRSTRTGRKRPPPDPVNPYHKKNGVEAPKDRALAHGRADRGIDERKPGYQKPMLSSTTTSVQSSW